MEKTATFDDLLSETEVEYATISIDKKTYRIGSITGEEFTEWEEQKAVSPEAKKVANFILISRSLVDESGKRIGDETKIAQLRKVKLKVSEAFLRAILKLNGVNQPAEVAAKKE